VNVTFIFARGVYVIRSGFACALYLLHESTVHCRAVQAPSRQARITHAIIVTDRDRAVGVPVPLQGTMRFSSDRKNAFKRWMTPDSLDFFLRGYMTYLQTLQQGLDFSSSHPTFNPLEPSGYYMYHQP
jgi:hypothetical protein